MKKVVVLLCLILGGSFAYWLSGAGRQETSASVSLPSAAEPSVRPAPSEIVIATVPSFQGRLLRFDPVTIGPCNVVPAREQTISSQVDGIVDEIVVDLGDKVVTGQVLATIDSQQIRAQAELLKIRSRSESAERIAQAQHDEAASKVAFAKKANESGLVAVPELEFKTYVLQQERYAQEINKAREEREIASKELKKVRVVLDQHQIHSALAGEIVKVHRRPGEAIKQTEPLFRVANCERIRLEGLCKARQADLLRIGMTALVEPELRGEQLTELVGHTAPITSIAMNADGSLLASAGEDRAVILWGWPLGNRLCLLPHPGEVTAVAFAPRTNQAGAWRLITGGSDGHARMWTVSTTGPIQPPLLFTQRHEGTLRAVAFSRDGSLCVTGGEDKRIGVWEAFTGNHLYWLETDEGGASVHKGAVTSLAFASDGMLISAGRDNCFKVWQISATSARLVDQIAGRTGEVSHFSFGPDANQLLFDHGEELRLLDRRSWDALVSLRGQRQGRFTGLAHFSPTGKLVLSSTNNGRVQLWKLPDFTGPHTRPADLTSYEIRHFVAPNGLAVTCGTFAPDESVIFTGGLDKVIRVWPIPPAVDWREPLSAQITYIGSEVERGTDTVRIRAEMDNPTGPGRRLRPGTFATLKIFTEKSN